MTPPDNGNGSKRTLPPLILHPFSDNTSPKKLVQSSRASLVLQGLLPSKEESIEELQQTLLEGRYCEIRMLYYVGKDTERWIDQCLDLVQREPELRTAGFEWQSFASLLIDDPPSAVLAKLRSWGVADHRSIFSRALALHSVFADAPGRELIAEEFLRNYHRYADQLFACRKSASPYATLSSSHFTFDLFASGEYTSMLERQWQSGEPSPPGDMPR
jgi:hypothetical protein